MVGGFVSYFHPEPVLCTAISTLAMFTGLTVYAMLMSDEEMNVLGGILVSLSFVVLPVIIFSLLFRSHFIYIIVQGIMVVLTYIYIILDTRLNMQEMSNDDYIIAALLVYSDIINLFLYLLVIFGRCCCSA